MSHEVELSVQLTHSNRLGVEYVGVGGVEQLSGGRLYALQLGLSVLQHIITLYNEMVISQTVCC